MRVPDGLAKYTHHRRPRWWAPGFPGRPNPGLPGEPDQVWFRPRILDVDRGAIAADVRGEAGPGGSARIGRRAAPYRSIQGVTTLMERSSVVHAIRNGERGAGRTVNHPTSSTSTRV